MGLVGRPSRWGQLTPARLLGGLVAEARMLFQRGRVPLAAIVGAPRSGSTLLIRLLDSHSLIAAPCEIGIPSVFPEGDEKYPVVLEKWHQICCYYGVEPTAARDDPDKLFRQILEREGKSLLVLKDPRSSLFMDELDRFSPRYVHLVRDARAVASSRMFAEPRIGFERWVAYNRSVVSFLTRSQEKRAMRLRYEDLIANPEEEVKTLLAMLGFSFERDMLAFGDHDHADARMLLWGGEGPQQSALQHDLGQSIRPPASVPIWPEYLVDLYEALPCVRELNEFFGYHS